MTRSLRSTLLALTIFGFLGLAIHLLSHSNALASYGSGMHISRMASMADSMRSVSLGLDAELSTMVNKAIGSTASLLDGDVIPSREAESLSMRLGQLRSQLRSLPRIDEDAFAMNTRIADQRRFVGALSELLNERRVMVEAMPTSMPATGRFTSPFGYRVHPISHVVKKHDGLDIAAPIGTPIYAAGGGKVVFSGVKGGYGNVVEIDHGFGYVSRYAHASRRLVEVGQEVQRGERIADVGSTGASTGPHLHFEVLVDSVAVNPAPFVNAPVTTPPQVASVAGTANGSI